MRLALWMRFLEARNSFLFLLPAVCTVEVIRMVRFPLVFNVAFLNNGAEINKSENVNSNAAGLQVATNTRLQKIVFGYNSICLSSPTGYEKSDILLSK